MSVNPTALTNTDRYNEAAWGIQDLIRIVAVPTGASPGLVGRNLLGQVLTENGDYECLIPLSGLTTALQVHLTATLATKTLSTDLDTLFYVPDLTNPATWTEKTAGTGTGSVTSATRQSAEITTLRGEQFARYTLTVAGAAGSVTITQAEYNGI